MKSGSDSNPVSDIEPVFNRVRPSAEPAAGPSSVPGAAPGATSPGKAEPVEGDSVAGAPTVFVPDPLKRGEPGMDGGADGGSDARGALVPATGEPDTPPRYAGSSVPAGRPSPATASPLPTVRIEVSPSPARVGESVTVQVLIESAREVRSAPFHLLFPANLLKFESATAGGFLTSPDAKLIFMADGPPGQVMVALSLLGGSQGASGAGELCRLNFRALASGRALLALEDLHVFFTDQSFITPSHAPRELIIQ